MMPADLAFLALDPPIVACSEGAMTMGAFDDPIARAEKLIDDRKADRARTQPNELRAMVAMETLADEITLLRAEMEMARKRQ